MKTAIYREYGPPEVLSIEEVEQPVPKDGEVLIRVHALSVTATDCIFRRGNPLMSRLYTGLTRPKHHTLGDEFAGEIVATGGGVSRFAVGDAVFGTTTGLGAYAEFLSLPADGVTLAHKPANISYEEAVACNDGAITSLTFLRDTGKIERGQKILIVGASGSLGTAAVQFGRYYGAEVTGVCSTANVELVKSLGAGTVLDYTRDDFTAARDTYDIIFDTVGKSSYPKCKRSLKRGGVYLSAAVGLGVLRHVLWTSLFGSRKAKIAAAGLRPPAERSEDLRFIASLIEAGTFKPVIDRRYPFEELVEAHRYVDRGHKKGNVVITVERPGE